MANQTTKKLDWNEGGCTYGERVISCSDQTITSYADVPADMTMGEAAADYMSTYDHNGYPGSVSLSLKLWESYADETEPDDTEETTYDDSDIFDIIDKKATRADGTIAGNGLWIASGDEEKRVFETHGEALAVAEKIAQEEAIDLDAAREYVASHEDDDDMDEDELAEVFVQVYGRKPDAKDRRDGVWSLICAGVER